MWLFLPDAFISVVQDRDNADQLIVRGRLPGDIERVFPGADVLKTPDADYLYRVSVTRRQLRAALMRAVDDLTYTNVKGAILPGDHLRHGAMLRCWSAMNSAQKEAETGQLFTFEEGDLDDEEQIDLELEDSVCRHGDDPYLCAKCDLEGRF